MNGRFMFGFQSFIFNSPFSILNFYINYPVSLRETPLQNLKGILGAASTLIIAKLTPQPQTHYTLTPFHLLTP